MFLCWSYSLYEQIFIYLLYLIYQVLIVDASGELNFPLELVEPLNSSILLNSPFRYSFNIFVKDAFIFKESESNK